MANILVVDDRAINRQLLVTLLGYKGHRVLEAADGEEALEVLDRERVALVITDIMMPRMDGAELAKRIRARKATAGLPVVFYTATYRAREARMMAEDCGVALVLAKPSSPETILRVVQIALGEHATAGAAEAAPGRRRTGAAAAEQQQQPAPEAAPLARNGEAQALLSRLAAVVELSLDAAVEHDPEHLLELFGRAAQDILSAKLVGLAVLTEDGASIEHCFVKETRRERAIWFEGSPPPAGVLAELLTDGRARRLRNVGGNPQAIGLPAAHPPVHLFLGVAIRSPTQTYGWLYAADKVTGREFDESDERLAVTVAAQLGLVYDNLRLRDEVQRAAEALALRHEELQTFAYSVSHDLKEPLREIRRLNTFLTDDYAALLDSQGREYLQTMDDTALFMGRLIEGLLALSRLSLEPSSPSVIDVIAIVRQIVARLQGSIEEAGARVVISDGAAKVLSDPFRIEQIFANLISNGLKFNKAPSPLVEVGVLRVTSATAVFYVRDNGIGIAPEYHERIFKLFDRLNAREAFEGAGAGLAIVQHAAELSGGRVWLESELGSGTTFYVVLPVVVASPSGGAVRAPGRASAAKEAA